MRDIMEKLGLTQIADTLVGDLRTPGMYLDVCHAFRGKVLAVSETEGDGTSSLGATYYCLFLVSVFYRLGRQGY